MPTKYVDVEGYAVNYFHTGQTTLPPVVPDVSKGRLFLYVHGAGSNGHFAHKMLDMLSANHSPLSFDFPGHGRSSGTESLKSVTAYSDFTYMLWKALGVRPVVIVGHSMGGAIALDLALRHADMLEGLALTCTAAKFNIPDELIKYLACGDERPPGTAVYQGFVLTSDAAGDHPRGLDGADQDRPARPLL